MEQDRVYDSLNTIDVYKNSQSCDRFSTYALLKRKFQGHKKIQGPLLPICKCIEMLKNYFEWNIILLGIGKFSIHLFWCITNDHYQRINCRQL